MEGIFVKNIRVYCDNEHFADGEKKYRTIFRGSEKVERIYVDVVLTNGNYPEEDWQGEISFRLLNADTHILIDRKTEEISISAQETERVFSSSIGHKSPGGKYILAVTVGGFARSTDFEIVDLPEESSGCFEIEDFSLSREKAGDDGGEETASRNKTQVCFAEKQLAGICARFAVRNKLSFPWPAEFFVSLFDHTGLLKERFVLSCASTDWDDDTLLFQFCFGEGEEEYWRRRAYRIEVVFMDELIIEAPFSVGDRNISIPFRPEAIRPHNFIGKRELNDAGKQNDKEGEPSDDDGWEITIGSAGFFNSSKQNLYEERWRSVFRAGCESDPIHFDVSLINDHYPDEGYCGNVKFALFDAETEKKIEEQKEYAIIDDDETNAMITVCFQELKRKGRYYAQVSVGDNTKRSHDIHLVDLPEDYGKCFILEDCSLFRRNEGEEQTEYKQNALTAFALDKLVGIDLLFVARNKLPFPWPSEFCVSLFNQQGLLMEERLWCKGAPIAGGGDKDLFHFVMQFGNGRIDFWRPGAYRVEIIFMDELIVEIPFTIGERNVETPFSADSVQPRRIHGGKQIISANALTGNPLEEINRMIGLGTLKNELRRYVEKVRYNAARQRAGLIVKPIALHSVYLGNPGTGKTTVARFMGKVFHELGLLSKGHVVVEERNSLTGKFYGSEEEKTNQAIERAQGGVLFIDEAYTLLVKDDSKDPGRRIIETLLTTLSNEDNRDICIILAGYPNPMIDMLNENPGMKSRFPNVYHFDDYSVDELMLIARSYLEENDYLITDEAEAALRRIVEKAHSARDSKFGNGRYIISLLENRIIANLASRLVVSGDIDRDLPINLIELQDVDNAATETNDVDYFRQKKYLGFKPTSSGHTS